MIMLFYKTCNMPVMNIAIKYFFICKYIELSSNKGRSDKRKQKTAPKIEAVLKIIKELAL